MFTGSRSDYSGDAALVGFHKKNGPLIGSFGEKMPFGLVNEEGVKYRFGSAYLSYQGIRFGIDSDRYIRHPIQDNFAHNVDFLFLDTTQPGFKSLSNDIVPYFKITPSSQNSKPTFSLYD